MLKVVSVAAFFLLIALLSLLAVASSSSPRLDMLSPPQLASLAFAAALGSAKSVVAVPMNGTSSAYPYAAASSAHATAVLSSPASAASGFPTALPSTLPDVCPSVSVQTVTVTVHAPAKPSATSGGPNEYPAVEVRGEGAWADAVGRARNMTADWSLEQLVNVTTGVGWMHGPCVCVFSHLVLTSALKLTPRIFRLSPGATSKHSPSSDSRACVSKIVLWGYASRTLCRSGRQVRRSW